MELIQTPSYTLNHLDDFRIFLCREKSRSKVHESEKLAALANQANTG